MTPCGPHAERRGGLRASAARPALLVALAVLAVASACGSPAPSGGATSTAPAPPATEVKLSEEQRIVLSQVLAKNFEAGGGTITVRLPNGSSTMTSEVDWTRKLGHATADNSGQEVEFYFGLGEVLDGTIPGLTEALAEEGRPGIRFVARYLDPRYSILDQVSSVILGLANEKRENPVALADQDIAYLGRRDVGGKPADVYRFGENTTYLVDPVEGTMVGLDAELKTVDGIVEFRIASLGPKEIRGPKSGEVVQGEEIAELFEQLAGKALPSPPTTAAPGSTAPG